MGEEGRERRRGDEGRRDVARASAPWIWISIPIVSDIVSCN